MVVEITNAAFKNIPDLIIGQVPLTCVLINLESRPGIENSIQE